MSLAGELMPASEIAFKAKRRQQHRIPYGTRIQRDCPESMKLFAWMWTVKHIAHGNESFLWSDPNAHPWRERSFIPLVHQLRLAFPLEGAIYFLNRLIPEKPASYRREPDLYYAHLIMNRVHKMYHHTDKNNKMKGISPENPAKWKTWPDIRRVHHLI